MEDSLEFHPDRPSFSLATPIAIATVVLSGLLITGSITVLLRNQNAVQTPKDEFHPLQEITVDVQGAVQKPGIKKFSRSFDSQVYLYEVIEQAGGYTDQVDTVAVSKALNLASPVRDGQKITVPNKNGLVSTEETSVSSNTRININTATQSQLEKLQGIGKTRAEQIVRFRPYTDLEELQVKTKIPVKVIQGIADAISF